MRYRVFSTAYLSDNDFIKCYGEYLDKFNHHIIKARIDHYDKRNIHGVGEVVYHTIEVDENDFVTFVKGLNDYCNDHYNKDCNGWAASKVIVGTFDGLDDKTYCYGETKHTVEDDSDPDKKPVTLELIIYDDYME